MKTKGSVSKIKFSSVIFFLILVGGCGFAAWKIIYRPQPPRSVNISAIRAEKGIPVTTIEAKSSSWEFWLPLYGAVSAPRLSQVSATKQEYITDVKVEVGDFVKAGDTLATLDNKNMLDRVEASRVRNKELEARYNRLHSVRQAGGTSSQETEAAFTQLRDSQAALNELTSDLARMKVVSPLNGVVVKRDADVGQLSSPTKPLFEIADMSLIEVTLDVAPTISSLIKAGLPAQVLTDTGWVSASVRRINPLASASTGLYNCVLVVDSPRPGMFKLGGTVECKVLIEKEASVIALPYEIVRDIGGNSVVYVVSGDAATERRVTRGRVSEQKVRILGGLSADEKLVQKGVDRVYDGAKIWIQDEGNK